MKIYIVILSFLISFSAFGQSDWSLAFSNNYGKLLNEDEPLISTEGLAQLRLSVTKTLHHRPNFGILGGIVVGIDGLSIKDYHIAYPADNNNGSIDIYKSSVNHFINHFVLGPVVKLAYNRPSSKYHGQFEMFYTYAIAKRQQQSLTESGKNRNIDHDIDGYFVERNHHTVEMYLKSGWHAFNIGRAPLIIGVSAGAHLLRALGQSEQTGKDINGRIVSLGFFIERTIPSTKNQS